ncbi:MAG: SRPBCC family protein [Bacteroidota bacterium]
MKLRIIHDGTGTNDKIFKGQIIRCKVNILPLWTAQWVSLISEVQAPDFFVDEQRSGPYALWHHMHQFQPVENGVEMVDQPKYAIPLGMLGRLAHGIFVGRELNSIFEYRYNVLNKIFRR